MNTIGVQVHPGDSNVAPNSYTQWTGGSGILDKLGAMVGGLVADPATPGSGKPGSPTTSGDATADTGPGGQTQTTKLLVLAAIVVVAFVLLKKS